MCESSLYLLKCAFISSAYASILLQFNASFVGSSLIQTITECDK